MRLLRPVVIALLVTAITGCTTAPRAVQGVPMGPDGEPLLPWVDDLAPAMKRARREGRPVLVMWTAEWCGPCKVMEGTSLRHPTVVEVLDREFVCARLDLDHDPDDASRYEVWAVPTLQVIRPDGSEVGRAAGSLMPNHILDWADEMLAETG